MPSAFIAAMKSLVLGVLMSTVSTTMIWLSMTFCDSALRTACWRILRGMSCSIAAHDRAKGHAAAAMMRGLAAALAPVAGALLLEELLGGAVLYFRAGLHLVRPEMRVGKLAQQRLMHQRMADRGAEDLLRQFDFADVLALLCSILVLSWSYNPFVSFAVSLTTTMPPFAPGTEPRTAIRLRSGSTIITLSRSDVESRCQMARHLLTLTRDPALCQRRST